MGVRADTLGTMLRLRREKPRQYFSVPEIIRELEPLATYSDQAVRDALGFLMDHPIYPIVYNNAPCTKHGWRVNP